MSLPMSLRRRFAIVLALGLSALVIAFVTIWSLLARSDNARERSADAIAKEGAYALAERVEGPSAIDLMEGPHLQSTAAAVLRPVPAAAGGYCTRGGLILANAGRLFRGEMPKGEGRHQLPPDVREAVAGLCMRVRPGAPVWGRFETTRGVDQVWAVPVADRGAAWFLARARPRGGEESPLWPFEVALLALAAVALAVFTVDAMMALRNGADELQGALVKLQEDLRAPVPRPRARELGDIAAGLSAMA